MTRPKHQERGSFFHLAQSNVSAAVVACLPFMKTLFSTGLKAQTQLTMATKWLRFTPANAISRPDNRAAGIAAIS